MRMLSAWLVLTFLAMCFVIRASADDDSRDGRLVSVMTQNLDLGATLSGAAAATTPQELIDAVTGIFHAVQATSFPERAEALADEIAAQHPDLIGLQEVALWRSQYPADLSPTPNALTVEFDFLQILLDALAVRGLRYDVVAVVVENDIEGPADAEGRRCIFPLGFSQGDCRDIRLTDREVILARADSRGPRLHLSNVQVGTFANNLTLSTLTGVFMAQRGWASVDVQVRGQSFRFITTHLDPDAPLVQVAQADEIVQGPAHTMLPVLFVCDCNSPADGTGTASYGHLIAAGFEDAWSAQHPRDPGFTCCEDENLLNSKPTLTARIDLVLFRGDFSVEDVTRVGDAPADRTPSGLWPSDHAGVVARLWLGHDD